MAWLGPDRVRSVDDARPPPLVPHNAHIRHGVPDSSAREAGEPTGALLKRALGDDYVSIALVARDVDIDWPGVAEPPVLELPNAVETILAERFAAPMLLVDLRATDVSAPQTAYWLAGEPGEPAALYTGLLYLDHARARSFVRPAPR